jgi:hypothetical protein
MRTTIGRMALTAAITGLGITATRRLAYRLAQTRLLDDTAMPAMIGPPAPAASLLIVGDSTALGTGASSPQASLAGRFAKAYPHLQIANRGRRGARFATLGDEIARHGQHDVIMILAGANDVIRHTGMAQLRADIDRAITQASKQAAHVVVVPAPNLGNAPIFPAPLSWWLTLRSRRLHAACRSSVQARGVTTRSHMIRHSSPAMTCIRAMPAMPSGLLNSSARRRCQAFWRRHGLVETQAGCRLARFSRRVLQRCWPWRCASVARQCVRQKLLARSSRSNT